VSTSQNVPSQPVGMTQFSRMHVSPQPTYTQPIQVSTSQNVPTLPQRSMSDFTRFHVSAQPSQQIPVSQFTVNQLTAPVVSSQSQMVRAALRQHIPISSQSAGIIYSSHITTPPTAIQNAANFVSQPPQNHVVQPHIPSVQTNTAQQYKPL
jgi:hypothetical protein